MHVRVSVFLGALGLVAAASAMAADNEKHGEALFKERCALCHQTNGAQGPDLAGVVGRSAGSTNFSYTQAMRNAHLQWDAATLDRFLANPTDVVPGTSMPINVADAGERRDLIAYLTTLRVQTSQAAAAAQPANEGSNEGSWRNDAPGKSHKIAAASLPAPFTTKSSANMSRSGDRPATVELKVPSGFAVKAFATKLSGPRVLRIAPNGDIFVVETRAGRVKVLRASDGAGEPSETSVFAEGLRGPFGLAFYPAANPEWIYVANLNSVVRFKYKTGDLKASGGPETIVEQLSETTGGHSTRDIAFSQDGKRMFVSVGSGSNYAESMGKKNAEDVKEWERTHTLGATWGNEANRADVLAFTPDGKNEKIFATGIRNCVGLTIQPANGKLWCVTNERDALGDDLVPDYATSVGEGKYYGWPWYYIGNHEEPRLKGERPDLAGKATVPDVLIQSHSAPIQIDFYTATSGPAAFPADYRGDAFVTLHGSWNRSDRTGYKVVRIRMQNNAPTGEYQDFLTGFVVNDSTVWGRPAGVAVAHDGSLLVSDDVSDTVWRIAPAR